MDKLPTDLIYEILLRTPAETVERCVAASPACASIVRKTSFYRDYHRQSLYTQQDRALLATRSVEPIFPETRIWNLRSISIVEQESTLLLCKTRLPMHDQRKDKFMNYSSGLLCSGPIVFNPSNGRHRVLPGVSCGEKEEVRSFIGFSSVSGFNVIAIKKDSCELLPLDAMAWKPIHCNLPYRPETASVCIEGTIYYAAYETPRSMVLISFSIETELFQITKIPQAPKLGAIFCEKTMNVNGKVGISFAAGGDTHVVRVLENPAKQLWSERLIQTPSSITIDIQHFSPLSFEGFTTFGESVFSQDVGFTKVIYYYNQENDSFRKHIHQGIESSQTLAFLGHVESTMFL